MQAVVPAGHRREVAYIQSRQAGMQVGAPLLKDRLTKLLEQNDIASAGSLAAHDRKGLSALIRMSYAKDTLVGWRAILAAGLAAKELVKSDPGFLRETCRKLLWSLTDESGGIGWSAPELLGEIIAADPKQFADLVPLVAEVSERNEDVFRPGVLYALGRIAEQAPEFVWGHRKAIISSLADKEPLVCIRGIMLVEKLLPAVKEGSLWNREFIDQIAVEFKRLDSDQGEAWIYQGREFISVVVGEAAKDVAKLIA